MPQSAVRAESTSDFDPRCANCGASLAFEPAPRHCPQCGQAVRLPTASEFVRDAVARYRHTIVMLIGQPGQLTLEYIAGRRERQVPPLRLYLLASFLFFLVVKVLGMTSTAHVVVAPAIDIHGNAITAKSNPALYKATMAEMQACVDRPGSCSWTQTLGARIGLKGAEQADHPEAVAQRMLSLAPNAVFVLLPVFAALLTLAYRTRGLRYGTHFVFSLHMHSFWFLMLLGLLQLPGALPLIGPPLLAAHALWAAQRVYGGRWWATSMRAVLVSVLYLAALFATIAGLSIASILLV